MYKVYLFICWFTPEHDTAIICQKLHIVSVGVIKTVTVAPTLFTPTLYVAATPDLCVTFLGEMVILIPAFADRT